MKITPARLTHVGRIATRMRAHDVTECTALGLSPKDALRRGLRMSLYCLSAIANDGEPMAMFGLTVVSALGGVARPWLLGTDRLFDHRRDMVVTGGRMIDWWRSEFPHLENIVSVENVKAIRLLKRWGAEVSDEAELHRGVAFVPFTIQARAGNA